MPVDIIANLKTLVGAKWIEGHDAMFLITSSYFFKRRTTLSPEVHKFFVSGTHNQKLGSVSPSFLDYRFVDKNELMQLGYTRKDKDHLECNDVYVFERIKFVKLNEKFQNAKAITLMPFLSNLATFFRALDEERFAYFDACWANIGWNDTTKTFCVIDLDSVDNSTYSYEELEKRINGNPMLHTSFLEFKTKYQTNKRLDDTRYLNLCTYQDLVFAFVLGLAKSDTKYSFMDKSGEVKALLSSYIKGDYTKTLGKNGTIPDDVRTILMNTTKVIDAYITGTYKGNPYNAIDRFVQQWALSRKPNVVKDTTKAVVTKTKNAAHWIKQRVKRRNTGILTANGKTKHRAKSIVYIVAFLLILHVISGPIFSLLGGIDKSLGVHQYTGKEISASFVPIHVDNIQPSKTYAYVEESNYSGIDVIDTDTTKVVSKINVSDGDIYGITPSADKSKLYIAVAKEVNYDYFGLIYVFDKNNATVTQCIPIVDKGTCAIPVATPDGKKLYMHFPGYRNSIAMLNLATNNVTTVPCDMRFATNMVITPDGKQLYVTSQLDTVDAACCSDVGYMAGGHCGEVGIIDTTTDEVVDYIEPGRVPFDVAITPFGDKAYIVNTDESNIVSVDTQVWKIRNTINDTNTTRPINVAIQDKNGTFTGEWNQGADPSSIAINPTGTKAYVTNNGNNTVAVINLNTNKITSMIHVDNKPQDVAFTPDGNYAYVTLPGSDTVDVIDARTDAVVATVAVGHSPTRIIIN